MKKDRDAATLARYWAWSDTMRGHFDAELQEKGVVDLDSDDGFNLALYMSYWYASLYVVVEGWQLLKLTDPDVDALLVSPYVDVLKRYRNGVFHFQRAMWDTRFTDFIYEGDASAHWVRQLHVALGTWLQRHVETMAAPG